MKLNILALALMSMSASSFTVRPTPSARCSLSLFSSAEKSVESSSSTAGNKDPLGLPPELRKITDAFAAVGDAQLRHKQLLYMANQLPTIDPAACTPENKVPGCLSTVYVDGKATWDDEKQANVINFVGDSDGLLTKGLVALLVR